MFDMVKTKWIKLKEKSGFLDDEAAAGGSIAGGIIALAIGMYILAYVFMPALQELFAANVTGIDVGVATLATVVVGAIMVIGILVMVLKAVGIKIG